MKRIYATRTLQKDKLFKEQQMNIEEYYKLSIIKEQKQKGYLKRLKVFNTTSNSFVKLTYDFESQYKEYARLTQQKISTIEQMAKDRGYVSLFITLTLPSSFHSFKSIPYKDKRLYTRRNNEFAYDKVDEAIKDGYKFLNELFKMFYKRIKYFTKKELLYVKTIEAHVTQIPHLHCLLFFPLDKYDEIVGVYKRIIAYYNLSRVDMEKVSIKNDINYASRYILKYIIKTLKDGSNYYGARILDGWKRANKIRLLSHSQIPLNQQLYKKIYHSFTNNKKNKIISKKDYKLFIDKKEIMYNRYKVMQKNGDKKFKGLPIFIVIDEVGTIGTHYDKKLRDSIFNDMIELFQKGRACKIVFMIFAQKCDSSNIPNNVLTNIQSRVFMKTDSEFNTNATIGTKEKIEEITIKEVSNFNRGRAIVKDGETSVKTLLQVPYISEEQHKSIVKSLTYLK